MKIVKPKIQNIEKISDILIQWTKKEEVSKYKSRIINEINGKTKFGMQFWIIKDNDIVIGIAGLANILPKIKKYSQTNNPVEIKILYLDKNQRGKGYGKAFLEFLENKARKDYKKEILIRSAIIYKDTAWGFYEKFGYKHLGTLNDGMVVFRKKI